MRRHATVRAATADRALSELLHPALVDALTPAQRADARTASIIVRGIAESLTADACAPALATVHPLRAARDTPPHRV